MEHPGPSRRPDPRAAAAVLGALGASATLGLWTVSRGPHGLAEGAATVVYVLVGGGALPLAYVLGAVGLGMFAGRAVRGARSGAALEVALGVAVMLTLSHLLGVLGVFGRGWGRWVAWAPVAGGIVVLIRRCVRGRGGGSVPWSYLLGLPGLAVLAVAVCSPPGVLWASEGGGYDALSYHLELPREWVGMGRLWPVEHNVYSFLPGYVEAAFYHVATLGGARGYDGLISGEGHLVIAAQALHALMAALSALLVAQAAQAVCARSGVDGRWSAGIAGSAALLTPWTVVTESLAYNDLAVVALGAGAMLAAVEHDVRPWARTALAAVLVGTACGAKPTAIVLAAPAVGVALAWTAPLRAWPAMLGVGVLVGSATLAPWMVRNAITCGNPVFPLAPGWFGSAHWSAEQVARYAAAHAPTGTLGERLALLGSAERGIVHVQWGAWAPVVVGALIACLVRPTTRRCGMMLGLGLAAQVAGWVLLTHQQSRFLLPLMVTGMPIVALALADVHRVIAAWSGAAFVLVQCAALVWVVAHEGPRGPDGRPLAMAALVPGVAYQTGVLAQRSGVGPAAALGPAAAVRVGLTPGTVVYLLGDATPLYYRWPVRYNTTWDAWPIAQAMRATDDPSRWSALLRAQGIDAVLVSLPELERLSRSGYIDPTVQPDRIGAWLEAMGEPALVWPDLGRALYLLEGVR